jgi:arylsulfatase A-like enzyme
MANTTRRPNILVIFGDDIGYWNVGAYTHGLMGTDLLGRVPFLCSKFRTALRYPTDSSENLQKI